MLRVPPLLRLDRAPALPLRRAAAAALLAAAALAAGPARAAQVVYATARTAFLDAGTREGLAQGAVLRLRSGKSCRIEALGDHYASCAVDGARAGDTFSLPPQKAAPALPPRTPIFPAEELKRQHARLAVASLPLVEFRSRPEIRKAVLYEARVVHATWGASTARPWQQERIDAWANGAPVGAGLSLYADLSARYWSRRFDPISSRPDKSAQLYVREATLRRDAPGAAFAVGRLRPWFAPGVTPLDGAQIGFRGRGGNEVGVYGGAVPTAISLSPSTDAGTAGAYWRLQGGMLRHEARVAVVSTPELGKRVEAEGLAQIMLGKYLDLAADVRGAAGDNSGLDAARVDLLARPVESLSLNASFRYLGLRLPERDGPSFIGLGGASRHGDASASWRAADWIILSVRGGGDRDLTSGTSRSFVGPEVSFPLVLSGVSAGYQEERGYASGRTAWLQASVQKPAWLRVSATGSWAYTKIGAFDGDELGLSLGAAADLSRNVALRVAAMSRVGGKTGPLQGALGYGVAGTAELAGRF